MFPFEPLFSSSVVKSEELSEQSDGHEILLSPAPQTPLQSHTPAQKTVGVEVGD